MNDKELLILAAKAAGIKGEYVERKLIVSDWGSGHLTGIQTASTAVWNPLEGDDYWFDGGALELAVKLSIGLYFDDIKQVVEARRPGVSYGQRYEYGNDKLGAARRAIMHAAADLALKMQ